MRLGVMLVVSVCQILLFGIAQAQTPEPLAGVRTVQVDPTVVPNAEKIKEEQAPIQVADSLRNALKDANFEIGEAPIRAHIVLDEFTSGSTTKRFMVGFGAGRSTVDCQLVIQDSTGKELANRRIRVRGNLMFSSYEDNKTQRRQAVTGFERKLTDEIEKLK